jgi:hypothetical protein
MTADHKLDFLEITRHILEIALESGILLSIFHRFSIPSIWDSFNVSMQLFMHVFAILMNSTWEQKWLAENWREQNGRATMCDSDAWRQKAESCWLWWQLRGGLAMKGTRTIFIFRRVKKGALGNSCQFIASTWLKTIPLPLRMAFKHISLWKKSSALTALFTRVQHTD